MVRSQGRLGTGRCPVIDDMVERIGNLIGAGTGIMIRIAAYENSRFRILSRALPRPLIGPV